MLLALAGAGLLALVGWDAVETTLSQRGAGPVTRGVEAVAERWRRRFGGSIGVPVVLSMIGLWIALTWTGWTLVFLSGTGNVVESATRAPVDVAGHAYFTAVTMTTLGSGDVIPAGPGWRLVAGATAFSGLILVTLSLTYLIPVVSAVVEKRRVAAYVSSLGGTPERILRVAWNGEDFSSLNDHVPTLVDAIELHTQRHGAYPVIHWFTSGDRRTALAPALAALHEALLLVEHGTAGEDRPDASPLRPLRKALNAYLDSMAGRYLDASGGSVETPAAPPLGWLENLGAPVADPGRYEAALRGAEPRRRALHALLIRQGW
ncbi:MAG: potassium channel family protein, partial [Gemmatimonadota bacterium]|nr:potassium channel family protein [Gemmatimonadota bacterium]